MDRRTLLAITLCFLIYMGWQKFYLEPRLPQTTISSQQQNNPAPQTTATTSQVAPEATAPTSSSTKRPTQTLPLDTATGPALVGDGSDIFVGWNIKKYHTGISNQTAAVNLPDVTHQDSQMDLAFDDPAYGYLSKVQGTLQKTPAGIEWTYEDANVKMTRLISRPDAQNYVSVQLTTNFKKRAPKYAFVSLTMPYVKGEYDERDRELVYFSNGSISRVSPKGVSLKETVNPAEYIGVNSRYFLFAVLNDGKAQPNALVQPLGEEKGRASLVYPVTGNTFSVPLKVFFGPKELGMLRSVSPKLDQTVNFGWFALFAYPLLSVLKFLDNFVGNYGVAIIILTILLKILTYPLTYKSMKNMREMAKIQPQLAKIREKFKNDKESLNREMMALMKEHGYNPAAGCLPMIIQIPIFFALDRVLYGSIDLYHAPFAFYMHDLAAKDPYYITPVLLSVVMWLQQKISPQNATMDPAQAKMMQFMPLMFGAFMINLPSGLNLYMLVNSITGIGQQWMLNKKFGISGSGGSRAPALVARNP